MGVSAAVAGIGAAGAIGGSLISSSSSASQSAANDAEMAKDKQNLAGVLGVPTQYGLSDYLNGQNYLQQYAGSAQDQFSRYNSENDQDASIRNALDGPLTSLAAQQTGEAATEGAANSAYNLANINNATTEMGNESTLAADDMSDFSNYYRPAADAAMGDMTSTLLPGAAGALSYAQNYANQATNAINPDQTADMAGADVAANYEAQQGALARQQAAMGIDPSSGNATTQNMNLALSEAVAKAGAETQGRVQGTQQQLTNEGNAAGALNSAVGEYGNVLGGVNTAATKGPGGMDLTQNYGRTSADTKINLTTPSAVQSASQMLWNNGNTGMTGLGTLGQSQEGNFYNVSNEDAQATGGMGSGGGSGASNGGFSGQGLGSALGTSLGAGYGMYNNKNATPAANGSGGLASGAGASSGTTGGLMGGLSGDFMDP